jgi:hypothetical protein
MDVTYVPAFIEVSVTIGYGEGTASARTDEEIEAGKKWPSFKFLERTKVNVAGFSAEQVVYTLDMLFHVSSDSGEERPTKVYRYVYFKDGTSLWCIESESELADRVKADFEHILQTFKILKEEL